MDPGEQEPDPGQFTSSIYIVDLTCPRTVLDIEDMDLKVIVTRNSSVEKEK